MWHIVTLYKNGSYKILGHHHTDELIIYNTKKPFESGHTHIKNYHTAVWLIKLAKYKTIPNRKTKYFLESLMRISDDNNYIRSLETIYYKLDRKK